MPTGSSSEESWTMGESLIQLSRMGDEGSIGCKTRNTGKIMTKPVGVVPANSVPAAAVEVVVWCCLERGRRGEREKPCNGRKCGATHGKNRLD